jgi:hypothetical protein
MRINRKSFKSNKGLFVVLGVLAIVVIAGKPTVRLLKEKYKLKQDEGIWRSPMERIMKMDCGILEFVRMSNVN